MIAIIQQLYQINENIHTHLPQMAQLWAFFFHSSLQNYDSRVDHLYQSDIFHENIIHSIFKSDKEERLT